MRGAIKGNLSPLVTIAHTPLLLVLSQYTSPELNNFTRASSDIEIRVCTNRTCKRQGSMETLKVLSEMAPPSVSVKSCGCLGRCRADPNVVVVLDAVFVGHCGTPARAADMMSFVCSGDEEPWRKSLEALVLRKRAENEVGNGNFCEAEVLLSQAVDLQPLGGIHIIYKDKFCCKVDNGQQGRGS